MHAPICWLWHEAKLCFPPLHCVVQAQAELAHWGEEISLEGIEKCENLHTGAADSLWPPGGLDGVLFVSTEMSTVSHTILQLNRCDDLCAAETETESPGPSILMQPPNELPAAGFPR